MLRGIDQASAASVLDLGRAARECSIADLAHPERVPIDPLSDNSAKDAPTIILGEELYARTLRVFPGSLVDLVCPLCKMGPNGPMPGLKSFRVAGHFYSGMSEFDASWHTSALSRGAGLSALAG